MAGHEPGHRGRGRVDAQRAPRRSQTHLFVLVTARSVGAVAHNDHLAWWGLIAGAVHGVLGGIVVGVWPDLHPDLHPDMPDRVPPPGVFYRHYGWPDVAQFIVGHLWFGVAAGVLYALLHAGLPPGAALPQAALGAGPPERVLPPRAGAGDVRFTAAGRLGWLLQQGSIRRGPVSLLPHCQAGGAAPRPRPGRAARKRVAVSPRARRAAHR